jgi:hypothetical protein
MQERASLREARASAWPQRPQGSGAPRQVQRCPCAWRGARRSNAAAGAEVPLRVAGREAQQRRG